MGKQWSVVGWIAGAAIVAACRDDDVRRDLPENPSAFVVVTDFETGAFSLLDVESRYAAPNVGLLHSDAVARVRGDRVYVLNRLGADNLTVLDAAAGFRPAYQVSTGPRSNPQDIAFASDAKAYVTRLGERSALVVDPRDGSRLGEVDCSAMADADGFPEMAGAIDAAGRVVLAAQRLDRNDLLRPTGPGALAIVDPETDRIERVVELRGANPYGDMALDADGRLLVAVVGRFGEIDGGIELVDLAAGASLGLAVREETLGGDASSFAVGPDGVLWVVVSEPGFSTAVVRFDPSDGSVRRVAASSGFVHSCVQFVADGVVAVCDRTRSAPGVRLFDAASGSEMTRAAIPVGLPPWQIRRLPSLPPPTPPPVP